MCCFEDLSLLCNPTKNINRQSCNLTIHVSSYNALFTIFFTSEIQRHFWYDLSDSNYSPVAFRSMQKVTTLGSGKKSISHPNFFFFHRRYFFLSQFFAVEMTTAWSSEDLFNCFCNVHCGLFQWESATLKNREMEGRCKDL